MSDYSIYPNAIDGYAQIPLAVDGQSPINASGVNRLRSAIINIENAIGVAPFLSEEYGSFPTVAKRLDGLDAKVSSFVSTTLNDAYLNGTSIETSFGGVGLVGSEYFIFRSLLGETVAQIHSNDFGLVVSSESKDISISSGASIDILSGGVIQIGTNNTFILFDDFSNNIVSQHPGNSPVFIAQSADAGFGIFAGGVDPSSGAGVPAPTASLYHRGDGVSGDLWLKSGPSDNDWVNILIDNGENNTASNIGAGGVGIFKQKSGINLEFKNLGATSNKVILTDHAPSDQINIDIADASTMQRGAARLADQADVNSGIDTESIVTPSTLAGSDLASDVSVNNLKTTNATHTGDVTGDSVLTISSNSVSNSKLAQMPDAAIKGNNSGGIADPADLSAADVTSMLDTFALGLQGLVPASTGGSDFLREDGSWATPANGEPPNEVLVTQLSDLPAPVSGEISLDPTKVYRISGIVDISPNSLTSTGPIVIYGGSYVLDGITTNTANPLISHNSGDQLEVRELFLSNPTGPVYHVDGLSSPTSDILIQRNIVTSSLAVGAFEDCGRLDVRDSLFTVCDDGVIIDGTNGSVSFSNIGANSNNGTFTWIKAPATASIDSFSVSYSNVNLDPLQTGLNLDPAVTITSAPAHIDDVTFSGGGTPLIGITKATPNFEFFQCIGILDSTTFGSAYAAPSPLFVISTSAVPINTYIDMGTSPATLGLYSSSPNIERFSMLNDQTGELLYTGVKPVTVVIKLAASTSSSSGASRPISLAVSIDDGGGYILCPESQFAAAANSDPSFIGAECTVFIAPGTKIKPQIKQIAGGSIDIEAYAVHINVHPISM